MNARLVATLGAAPRSRTKGCLIEPWIGTDAARDLRLSKRRLAIINIQRARRHEKAPALEATLGRFVLNELVKQ
ncbi:MAG: hypothetical protein JHD07_25085 [Bradyrhizobium sp.]|uniref:hypothetical protein n=1 Tax=Bradyrhizobium sp. TaxID=376 RepID=UPI001A30E469|nr:hypothetical protein [Bradyrhizobium sp.]MBJ7406397.1 hypothetical protein [Bradyrhizobium sp.]